MAILTVGRMENPHQPTVDDFGARFNRYLKYWNGLMADQNTPAPTSFDRRFCVLPRRLPSQGGGSQFTGGCPNIDRWYEKSRPFGRPKNLDFSQG